MRNCSLSSIYRRSSFIKSAGKTIDQFKAELQAEGKTALQWAEEHDFPSWAVYRVMAGLNKCHRGRAHRIAVAMGIKSAGANRQAA